MSDTINILNEPMSEQIRRISWVKMNRDQRVATLHLIRAHTKKALNDLDIAINLVQFSQCGEFKFNAMCMGTGLDLWNDTTKTHYEVSLAKGLDQLV